MRFVLPLRKTAFPGNCGVCFFFSFLLFPSFLGFFPAPICFAGKSPQGPPPFYVQPTSLCFLPARRPLALKWSGAHLFLLLEIVLFFEVLGTDTLEGVFFFTSLFLSIRSNFFPLSFLLKALRLRGGNSFFPASPLTSPRLWSQHSTKSVLILFISPLILFFLFVPVDCFYRVILLRG